MEEILPHVFVLKPVYTRGIRALGPHLWSPWTCTCGFGQTGADDEAALRQFEAHLKNFTSRVS